MVCGRWLPGCQLLFCHNRDTISLNTLPVNLYPWQHGSQAYFVFWCMALVTAFRQYRQQSEQAERRGEQTGIGTFRRHLKAANRDKVIIFCAGHFGIFRNFEVVMLLGGLVRDRAMMGESAQTVLERCRGGPRESS